MAKLRISCSIVFTCTFVISIMSLSVDADCYVGSIESENDGKISISSYSKLKVQDCGPQPTPTATTSTAGTTATTEVATTVVTIASTTTAEPNATKAAESVTTTATEPNATTASEAVNIPATKAAAPNKEPSPPPGRQQRAVIEDDPPTKYCSVFKYFTNPELTVDSKWIANFTCLGVCENSDNTTSNGTIGVLTCCNTTKCNSLDRFMSDEEVSFETVGNCAVGKINGSDSNVKTGQPCKSMDSYFCVNTTHADGMITYGCSQKQDNNFCLKNGLSGTGCADNAADKSKTCCCTWGNCNEPTHVDPTPTPAPKPTPTPAPSHGISTGAVVGFVFMGFFLGLIAGMCLTCYCVKRNKNSDAPDFNYSRITADSTDEANY